MANNKAEKKAKNSLLKKTQKAKVSKSVQDAIPYQAVSYNGIFEIDSNHYSKAYQFNDMNFDTETEEAQDRILKSFEGVINKFNVNVTLQFAIYNQKLPDKDMVDRFFLKSRLRSGEVSPEMYTAIESYRREYNEIISQNITSGNNDIEKIRLIVLTVETDCMESANSIFKNLDMDVNEVVKAVNKQGVKALTTKERLVLLYRIFHADSNLDFEKVLDQYNDEYGQFDPERLAKKGAKTKDLIASAAIVKNYSNLQLDEHLFARTFAVTDFPPTMDTKFLTSVTDIPCAMMTSVIHSPLPRKESSRLVRNRMNNIKSDMIKASKQAYNSHYSPDLISEDLTNAKEEAEFMVRDVNVRKKKLFLTTMTITIFAESIEALDLYSDMLDTKLSSEYNCQFVALQGQQLIGFKTGMPFARNYLEYDRLMTSEDCKAIFPFSVKELMDRNGHFYGLNDVTKNMIIYDRKNSDLPNGLIFGKSGSGKSFSAKGELIANLLDYPNDGYIILDPDGEYAPIARQFGGTVIDLTLKSNVHINPLDLDMEPDEKKVDPIAEKIDYLVSILESIRHNRPLMPYEVTIVQRAGKKMYDTYAAHLEAVNETREPSKQISYDAAACPTLLDFYEILNDEAVSGAEGRNLALELEPYAVGQYSFFAHKTNLQSDPNFIVYNLKFMPQNVKEFAMKVCLADIWNRAIRNKSLSRATWVYLDEFYLLAQTEGAALTLMQYWKRIRKYYGIMTGITQDISDLLMTHQGQAMVNNSGFCLMMKQADEGVTYLSETFSIPSMLCDYMRDKPQGYGLLYNGSSVVPFNYTIPEGSELYSLITTRPSDEAQEV
jgi:type IV secretory pathway VirB4 component